MPPITPPIKDEQANDAQRELFDEVKQRVGRVSTTVRMLAHHPPLARDVLDNQGRYLHDGLGHLDLAWREAIALAVSSANGCINCVKAHRQNCHKAGWSEQDTAAILAVEAQLAMRCTHDRVQQALADAAAAHDPVADQPPFATRVLDEPAIDAKLVTLIGLCVCCALGCTRLASHYARQAEADGLTAGQVQEAAGVAAVMTSLNHYFRIQHG